jgi:hypothetical protein
MRPRYHFVTTWVARNGAVVRVEDGKVYTGQSAIIRAFEKALEEVSCSA